MKTSALSLVLIGLTCAAPASAQTDSASRPTTETVIVTAHRLHTGVTPNAIAHDFVKSLAMPSLLTEQISRWQTPICPTFLGVAPQYAAVMDYHLRQIATKAGAPMKEKGCRPNLYVVVTPEPQVYLDALHAKSSDFLGYRGATTVTHPVQAWYVTGTTDIRGQVFVDRDVFGSPADCSSHDLCLPGTPPQTNVGGWRFHPDVSSAVIYATIIVDSGKTARDNVASIADYVAMMALSRSEDYGDCQLIPSIANLLTPNCDDKLKPDAITPSDIAYLKGVYKMDAGAALQVQQNQIAAEMEKSLGGQ